MDQPISIKNFFSYCFNSTRFRRKSKVNENLETSKYISRRNDSEPESKTTTLKKSRFHKLISKNDTPSNHKKKRFSNGNSSNDADEVTGTNPPSITKKPKKKAFSNCFKKYSSGDEAVKVKNFPILTKLDIATTVQRSLKEENCKQKEAKPSQQLEADAAIHYSHNSAVELMSRDGTLQLYSATTLTPLSSFAIQDEERIQTHLSVSCFRPDNEVKYSSSDGPDDVFDSNDEKSTHLASNFRTLNIGLSKSTSESCGSRNRRNKPSHVNCNKETGYLVKDFVSTDESPSLYENRNKDHLQYYTQNKVSPFPDYCPCLEAENVTSCIYGARRVSKLPQTSHAEDTASKFPSSFLKHDQSARSAHGCTSVTNHIPLEVSPVKRWILQLYFDSLVAASEDLYCGHKNLNNIYTTENKTVYSSPLFESTNARAFHPLALEGQNLREVSARTSSPHSHAASDESSSYLPPARGRNTYSKIKSENQHCDWQGLDMKCRNLKSKNHGRSKKCDDQYYTEKENKLNTIRAKSVPTAAKSQRRPTKDKHRKSKPAVFSQNATYTHYPFIDGPFAITTDKMTPIINMGPNYESWIQTVRSEDDLV